MHTAGWAPPGNKGGGAGLTRRPRAEVARGAREAHAARSNWYRYWQPLPPMFTEALTVRQTEALTPMPMSVVVQPVISGGVTNDRARRQLTGAARAPPQLQG